MQKGGVSMDVVNANQAQIAEEAGAVSIPVMGKVRIGHFVKAQVLEVLGVDMIDESKVLTPADEEYHIEKRNSPCRSSAVPGTLARPSAASMRVQP